MAKAIQFRGEAAVTIDGVETTLRLSISEIEAIEARDARGMIGLFMGLSNMETAKLSDAVFVIGQGMVGAGDKGGVDKARALAASAPMTDLVQAACLLLNAQFTAKTEDKPGNAPAATGAAA
jgi:hypothetical protein